MTYTVHSVFKTVQGEGAHMGRTAVFCRFAGCNLWTGREQDRPSAICRFCDTDFRGGTKYQSADVLVNAIETAWGVTMASRFVVLTGGEPALQLDQYLSMELKKRGFYIAIETNGTVKLDGKVDWKTVSPKDGTRLVETRANELKLVYPQGIDPESIRAEVVADYWTLQPMDGAELKDNTAKAVAYVSAHPWWRLGIQAHKHWEIA